MRRHMVRRTLYRLVQQQTLASTCDDDDLQLDEHCEGEGLGQTVDQSQSSVDSMDFS